MTAERTPAPDPILTMVPEVRGRRVLKPCVLYARLGRGGMGAVYLGKHLTLLQKQVVKCLWLMGSGNPGQGGFVERFQQEARIAAAMTHQNLVRVTHVDRLAELHYLVMEYVEGEDVDRRIQRTGPMAEEAALTTLLGAAQGLGYAHARGIVHRDVKPANLMISTHGEVKVIDLGLARAMDTTRQNGATVGTLGTPQYMPPEQWQDPAIGPEGDVFALGAVLHFLLTGRSPLAGNGTDFGTLRAAANDPRLADRVAGELRASRATRRLMRRCLAADPRERFADARELAAELAELVAGDPALLAAGAAMQQVEGREPADDELRAIGHALATGGEVATPAAVDHTVVTPDTDALDRTLQVPGSDGVAAADRRRAGAGDTAAMPAIAATMVPGTATPATPLITPRILPAPTAPRLRRRHARTTAAITAATVAIVATAGVVMWPRVDYEAVQREAMAAIYQERFDDAERALLQLERAPAFADQARRLHIDALVKAAEREAERQPVAALQRLATAKTIAAQLLIARDTDDAVARIAAAKQAPRKAIEDALAAALTVQSPPAGTVVTRATQAVTASFEPGPLALRASLQDHPLRRGDDGVWHGEWAAPAADGEAEVQIVVEEPITGIHRTIGVPVQVRRGAVALHVEAPATPQNGPAPEFSATVDNGPVTVHATVTAPDGSVHDLDLGEHDGPFRFALPDSAGHDGVYRVRLTAQAFEQDVASPECSITVDRTPPELRIEAGGRWCAAATMLLGGAASEACRVFVVGDEGRAVATDPAGRFNLPVTLPATDGPLTLHLAARDAAGNEGLAQAIEVIVDRTAPQLTANSLRHDAATAAERLVVTGTVDEPGTVTAGDEAPIETADDGTFTLTVPLPAGEIEQPASIRLVARDRAGNAAPPVTITVLVDRRGPRILPGAPDGSWSAAGEWCLRIEDRSLPCHVEADGKELQIAADGIVRITRPAGSAEIRVTARDALGNTSTHALSAGSETEAQGAAPPGPTWGTPVAGAAIDPALHVYERVTIDIGGEPVVLRLIRPLRDEELPPRAQRDARAVAMLQSLPPFYLAETELPVAVWRRDADTNTNTNSDANPAATDARRCYRFDPKTCQWTQGGDADWRQPLDQAFLAATPAEMRERWPVTMVTATEARAFCTRHGLRLPTVDEWSAVARMGSRDRYGWLPSGPLEQRANLADLKLAAMAPALAAFDAVDDGYAALAPVDAFPLAAQQHPWGFRNLLGNAAEWCSVRGDRTAACGGSWLSEPRDLRVGDSVPDAAITSGAWDCVGFRVARDL